ncbi:hypothetical protein ABZ770_39090 [Streptomyces sp. NPDC006654]|uniref:phosphorylase family protein n=1 Tax=Streptomyces sp. NPDC006654 TaxID=3156897 RepID=UPI0033F7DF05
MRGRLPGTDWQAALAELGEGNGTATTRLIEWLGPEAVLFDGVAASLKADVGLADVVIGTKVYGIHGGKRTPDGFLVRPEAWPVSYALVSAGRSAVRDMPGVRVHFKPIASGAVVLADAESGIAQHLRPDGHPGHPRHQRPRRRGRAHGRRLGFPAARRRTRRVGGGGRAAQAPPPRVPGL